MATRADQVKASEERSNSEARRAANPPAGPNKNARFREATAASKKGRALHGRTKLQADAKAGKPDPGRVDPFWKTGINGGEPQTVNGVAEGRGADGPASVAKASRKSTRGEVPGGEKNGQLPRAETRNLYTPEMRAARGR